MTELSNPHDKFFKETFSRPEAARSFLENYLPTDVVGVLRLDTLDLRKGTFVDPDLQAHFSDLLYRVTLQTSREALVYLLLEHKSQPDPQTPFQLGQRLLQFTPLFRRLANTETALEYLRTVLIYAAAASDRVTEPDLARAAQAALQERGDEIMPTLMEQWIEQGKKEGLEQGLEQGWERGLEQSVLRVLRQRFEETPAEIEERIRALPTRSLEQALDEAVAAPDLETFARWLTAVAAEEQ